MVLLVFPCVLFFFFFFFLTLLPLYFSRHKLLLVFGSRMMLTCAVQLVPLVPMTWVRRLRYFAFSNLLADVLIFIGLMSILGYAVYHMKVRAISAGGRFSECNIWVPTPLLSKHPAAQSTPFVLEPFLPASNTQCFPHRALFPRRRRWCLPCLFLDSALRTRNENSMRSTPPTFPCSLAPRSIPLKALAWSV